MQILEVVSGLYDLVVNLKRDYERSSTDTQNLIAISKTLDQLKRGKVFYEKRTITE